LPTPLQKHHDSLKTPILSKSFFFFKYLYPVSYLPGIREEQEDLERAAFFLK
jgi:hypothetical protein